MSEVEQDILKNLLMQLAKKIEQVNDTIKRFEHALKWFDKTAKEVHDSMKFINKIIKEKENEG